VQNVEAVASVHTDGIGIPARNVEGLVFASMASRKHLVENQAAVEVVSVSTAKRNVGVNMAAGALEFACAAEKDIIVKTVKELVFVSMGDLSVHAEIVVEKAFVSTESSSIRVEKDVGALAFASVGQISPTVKMDAAAGTSARTFDSS
jgi:hypothetical protein